MAEKEPTNDPGILAIQGIASPEKIERDMVEAVRAHVRTVREGRGPVGRIEDTFPLQRKLAGAIDYLRRYERAVKAVRKELTDTLEEEAADGGNSAAEQPATAPAWNGTAVPAANVTVPDSEGDWKVTREFDRKTEVDWVQVLIPGVQAALAVSIAENANVELDELEDDDLEYANLLGQAVLTRVLLDLELAASKLSPKVTGLKALADRYAREGDDKSASIVNSAVQKTSAYKGVKVERG